MEMGVDIGGISAVVMSNVPPMPAQTIYKEQVEQGRRVKNKSLALTFLCSKSIGLHTMNNPKWAPGTQKCTSYSKICAIIL